MGKIKNRKFWQGRTVLVTGHEGFLGSHLTKALVERGAKVVGFDKVKNRPFSVLKDLRKKIVSLKADVSEPISVNNAITRYKPAIIFHLAAEAIVNEANANPVRTFKSNIEGTWNVLEGVRGRKFIEAVIVASSDKAYGSHNVLPYKEETNLKGDHPYDVSKACADLLSSAYHNTYKVPVCVTRCGNIYGPGDHHLSRIIPDAVRSALEDKVLLIRSDGTYTRDYIYVDDIVLGYIGLAEKMRRMNLYGEVFNFSNERPVSVLKLVRTIYALVGSRPNYRVLNRARYEIRNQYLCAKKARDRLGWQPAFSLRKGLVKTINWYRDLFTK